MKRIFYYSVLFLCTISLSLSADWEAQADKLLSYLDGAQNEDYIGEPISQLEHALQCAHLAGQSGADSEAVLAALFHDIGHLCPLDDMHEKGEYGVADHDIVGAEFLRENGMSEKVCQLVLGHVQAKRYLTGVDKEYYDKLSDASKMTLQMQGGPMSLEEAKEFEDDPLFALKIQMRSWDECAKIPGLEVPGLDLYRPLLIEHLLQNAAGKE